MAFCHSSCQSKPGMSRRTPRLKASLLLSCSSVYKKRIPSMSDRKNRVTSGLIVRMCFCFHNTEPLFINLLLYLNKSICTLREAIHTKIVWLYAVNPTLGKKKTEESN
ncbi:Dedicator Of Cytokinesis Protein 11 [Manis pentadactyla]|nr:Dedicator Of Cytokinesis Protein 11 [Manis pentadactyla]